MTNYALFLSYIRKSGMSIYHIDYDKFHATDGPIPSIFDRVITLPWSDVHQGDLEELKCIVETARDLKRAFS